MRTRSLAAGIAIALTVAACGDTASNTTTSEAPTPPVTGTVAPSTNAGSTAGSTAAPTTTSVPTTAPQISTTTEPPGADAVIEVRLADGAVTAPQRPEVEAGSTVLLIVDGDVADEVHIHGYDYFLDLSPGAAAELEFIADIPGIFEVELERGRTLLFELVVR
jgi:hypothetical protein